MAVTPYLFYEDLDCALKWHAKAFGFRKFGPTYQNPRRLGHVTQNLYVTVKGVDKRFARAKNAGAKVLEEPLNTPYGHRRCGVEDPEGHQWFFAEPIKKPPRRSA